MILIRNICNWLWLWLIRYWERLPERRSNAWTLIIRNTSSPRLRLIRGIRFWTKLSISLSSSIPLLYRSTWISLRHSLFSSLSLFSSSPFSLNSILSRCFFSIFLLLSSVYSSLSPFLFHTLLIYSFLSSLSLSYTSLIFLPPSFPFSYWTLLISQTSPYLPLNLSRLLISMISPQMSHFSLSPLTCLSLSSEYMNCSQIFYKRMPPEAVDLVSRLLQYSPNLRCTAVSALSLSLSRYIYHNV